MLGEVAKPERACRHELCHPMAGRNKNCSRKLVWRVGCSGIAKPLISFGKLEIPTIVCLSSSAKVGDLN